MVGEQPGRVRPVARRLGVPDGVDHLAMLGEPSGGPPVQRRHLFGPRPAQLQPQEIPEQVVVAKPRALGVERDHKRVRVLELQQDPLRARAAGQQVGQLTVDAIEQGGAQEQLLDVVGLAVQHLGEQVLGDGAVAAGELGHEPLGVGVTGQRERRQPQARGPPLGPLVQQRRPSLGQRDPRGVQELAGFALGKAQVGCADLGQLAGQAELMQAQPRDRDAWPAPHARCGGRFVSSRVSWASASGECSSWRSSITSVTPSRASASSDSTRSTIARPLKPGVAAGRFRVAGYTGGVTDRVEQGQPEQLGVVLVALHLQHGEPMRLPRTVGPGAQQRRLAAAGRGRDDRHLARRRAIQARRGAHPGRPAGESSDPPSSACLDIYA